MSMGSDQCAIWIDADHREDELTSKEKYVRDLFAEQYSIDFNHEFAAMRIGFHHAFADEFGRKLLNDGYTQRRLLEIASRPHTDKELEILKTRTINLALREANDRFSKSTTRISAISLLAKVFQLETGSDDPLFGDYAKGGVMQVPSLTDPDDWSNMAAKSQAALKSNVRE